MANLPPFRQRFPWIGPDLQTLRDSIRPQAFPVDQAEPVLIPVTAGPQPEGQLLALLDRPVPPTAGARAGAARALVVLVHGLGGSSQSVGVRRLARLLLGHGMAVVRLNLRGAGAGRALAAGTYAAACTSDLEPVLAWCRTLAGGLGPDGGPVPLMAVGLSLGGTVVLNAVLQDPDPQGPARFPAVDGLACVSSPLDLLLGVQRMERPRNRLYQHWMLQRLVAQTRADPQGLGASEERALAAAAAGGTIRGFDQAITAPRWGYGSVEAYYEAASVLPALLRRGGGPPLLLLHAADDPWVPVEPLVQLQASGAAGLQGVITPTGGHHGFHSRHDLADATWADQVVSRWLLEQLRVPLAPGGCASSHITG